MSDFLQLAKKRANVKLQITRFYNYIKAAKEDASEQVQLRLEKVMDLWDKFTEIQDKIAALDKGESPNESERERKEFEDVYFESVAKAKKLVKANPDGVPKVKVKLPTLHLPTLDGSYSQWLLFKDTLSTLVDRNSDLTDIQKLQYLRSGLKADALAVIQALETSAENYKIAWELLLASFENKKLIINTHVKALFELSPISKENASSIRVFVNNLRMQRSLESLGEPVQHWSTLLIYMASNNLTLNLRKEWEYHVAKLEASSVKSHNLENSSDSDAEADWEFKHKIDHLLEFLTSRCQTLELIEKSKNILGNEVIQKKPEKGSICSDELARLQVL